MTIDGQVVQGVSTYGVVNPATGQVERHAPTCALEQLDAAFAAAAAAQGPWRRSQEERRKYMLLLAEAITVSADELIEDLVLETGKPTGVAASEPAICSTWLQVFGGMDVPRQTLQDDDSALIEVVPRPLGVIGAITPWNFPLSLAMWKIAPALLAGNTLVLKPSPFTPLATLRMGRILGEVLPPGVVNVVSGGDELGRALVSHPTPRKISFTGSIEAGKSVAAVAGADLKRLTLELGGNDAAILLEDVDAGAAAQALLRVAFFNVGQGCALPKRIYAPAHRYGEIVDAFAAVANSIVVGDPRDPSTQMGPLSTHQQYQRVCELTSEAIGQGARVAAGGGPIDGPGFFFEPTVLADVKEGVRVVDEEQFGPVLPILSYDDVDDAVARANSTMYGLCGSVWSGDEAQARAVAEQLQCGSAFVNTHAAVMPTVPFRGAKWSGIGVELGLDGVLAFTEPQVVHTARG